MSTSLAPPPFQLNPAQNQLEAERKAAEGEAEARLLARLAKEKREIERARLAAELGPPPDYDPVTGIKHFTAPRANR